MLTLCRPALIGLLLGSALAGSTAAQETAPAGTARTYLDLRESEDRGTQLLAERYYNLVRRQEWTSMDNKQKVLAKYVAHDPNFKWVKLETARGSGENRVTREVQVPVDKLSKACQNRVRRIAFLQPKLDELLAAAPDTPAEGMAGAGGEYAVGPPRGMRGERGGYGYGESGGYGSPTGDATAEDPAAGDVSATERPYSAAETQVDNGANDPDPLGFGELANEPPLDTSAGYGVVPPGVEGVPTGYEVGRPGGDPAAAGSADRSQWATSYDAFLANFTSTANQGGSIDWGELADLQAMNDAAAEHSRDSSADPSRSNISDLANRLGEVRWQGMFIRVESQQAGGPLVVFNYRPLPDPLKIRFIADESEASAFSAMQRGQIVAFVGRFDIKTPNEIDVYIRQAN
jgi:hypothetical protein